jgi:hypothetical protein
VRRKVDVNREKLKREGGENIRRDEIVFKKNMMISRFRHKNV